MEDKIRILSRVLGEDRIKRGVDLTEHLYTKLGGPAEVFYIATTLRELIRAVETCNELRINFLIIGQGSKIAISPQGFKGLVIKNRADNVKVFGIKGKVSREGIGIEEAIIEADSGVSLQKLASFSSSQNLAGFDSLFSAAGTVGGSVHTNLTVRERAYQIKALSEAGKIRISQLKDLSQEDIVLSVAFKLKAKEKNNVNH